jgi:hypothetical protein
MARTLSRTYFGVSTVLGALALLFVLANYSVASPGPITRASVDGSGAEANSGSFTSALSSDGRYVVFVSGANLVPDDTNDGLDIYVRDLQTGTIQVGYQFRQDPGLYGAHHADEGPGA